MISIFELARLQIPIYGYHRTVPYINLFGDNRSLRFAVRFTSVGALLFLEEKMKKVRKWFLSILFIFILGMVMLSACSGNERQEGTDYPVVGIWHASASWHEITQSTILGQIHEFDDVYQLDVYFDFREDGTLLNKRRLSMNGIDWEDDLTDWTIVNLTWTVSKNVIKLSNGKHYVIVDNQFDDLYPGNIILHYIKEN